MFPRTTYKGGIASSQRNLVHVAEGEAQWGQHAIPVCASPEWTGARQGDREAQAAQRAHQAHIASLGASALVLAVGAQVRSKIGTSATRHRPLCSRGSSAPVYTRGLWNGEWGAACHVTHPCTRCRAGGLWHRYAWLSCCDLQIAFLVSRGVGGGGPWEWAPWTQPEQRSHSAADARAQVIQVKIGPVALSRPHPFQHRRRMNGPPS